MQLDRNQITLLLLLGSHHSLKTTSETTRKIYESLVALGLMTPLRTGYPSARHTFTDRHSVSYAFGDFTHQGRTLILELQSWLETLKFSFRGEFEHPTWNISPRPTTKGLSKDRRHNPRYYAKTDGPVA